MIRAAGRWILAEFERFLHTRQMLWIGEHLVPLMCAAILALMVVIFAGIGAVVDRQHESALEGCERGNETRPLDVLNLQTDRDVLRDDIHKLAAQIRLLRALPSAPGNRYIKVAKGDKRTKHHAIDVKTQSIRSKVDSIADVHRPGEPLIVDCEKAYP